MKLCHCGSPQIHHDKHGRDGSEPDLCDVCYWRTKARELDLYVKRLEDAGDAMEPYTTSNEAEAWDKARKAKP